MYALNQTGRPVLITPPEVIKKTGTNNLDSGRVAPGIEIAEIRFLQGSDALGGSFYGALTAEKNRVVDGGNMAALQALVSAQYAGGVGAPVLKAGDIVNAAEFLSSANRTLWDWYLWKYVAECVIYTSIPDNYLDFTSAGMLKQNPIGSALDPGSKTTVGPSLSDIKFVMDKYLRERIEPLRVGLLDYLGTNAANFPTWAQSRRGAEKRSAYVDLSIYRDQDAGRCGCTWAGNNPGRGPSSGCCDPEDPLLW